MLKKPIQNSVTCHGTSNMLARFTPAQFIMIKSGRIKLDEN